MAPTFMLLIIMWTPQGMTSQAMPVISKQVCEREAEKAQDLGGAFTTIKTLCIQTN